MRAGKSGLTLVELLVVMAILGMMTGLLLTRVQAVRENARRTVCQNNLKQVGVALAVFEASKGRFPPGVYANARVSFASTNTGTTWKADFRFAEWTCYLHGILPGLEEESFYTAVGGPAFRKDKVDNKPQDFADVHGRTISGLLCPSDNIVSGCWQTPWSVQPTGVSGTVSLRLAKSNYLGFFSGLQVVDTTVPLVAAGTQYKAVAVYPLPPKPYDKRAVFGYGMPSENESTKGTADRLGTDLRLIKDGLSNTMAMAEYLRGNAETNGRGAFWLNVGGFQMIFATNPPNPGLTRVGTSGNANYSSNSTAKTIADADWLPDQIYGCGLYNTLTEADNPKMNLPCLPSVQLSSGDEVDNSSYASARSRHVGGVFALFCDGHVQFIADSIDSSTTTGAYGTWQKLAWIDDGQRLDPNKF